MDHLLAHLAPVSDAAWVEITTEATRSLAHFLGARKVVDYTAGGWSTAARPVGRVTGLDAGADVEMAARQVQPLVEVRVPFTMSRSELDAADRGATDTDTNPVIAAARTAALTEDSAVFGGSEQALVAGILSSSPHDPIAVRGVDTIPQAVTQALVQLNRAGVAGPYALVLGEAAWATVMESAEQGGYPLLKHLRLIVDGPVVWSPGLAGGVLLSQRGGDFEIFGGQDWSIGYRSHDADSVTLYLEESFTFVVNTPEAAVALRIGS